MKIVLIAIMIDVTVLVSNKKKKKKTHSCYHYDHIVRDMHQIMLKENIVLGLLGAPIKNYFGPGY